MADFDAFARRSRPRMSCTTVQTEGPTLGAFKAARSVRTKKSADDTIAKDVSDMNAYTRVHKRPVRG